MAAFILLLSLLSQLTPRAVAVDEYVMRYKDSVETICLGTRTPAVSTATFTNSPSDVSDLPEGFDPTTPRFLYIGSKTNFQGKHKCANNIDYYMYDPASSTFTTLSYANLPTSVQTSSFVFSLLRASSNSVSLNVLNSYPTPLTFYGTSEAVTVNATSSPITANVQILDPSTISDSVGAFTTQIALSSKGANLKAAIILTAGSPATNNGFWTVDYVIYRVKKKDSSCMPSGMAPSYTNGASATDNGACVSAHSATAVLAADSPVLTQQKVKKPKKVAKPGHGRKLLHSRNLKCYCGGQDGVVPKCGSYACYYTAYGRCCYCI